MPALARLVDNAIERWGTSVVELAVFGTDDAAAIAAHVDAFCGARLGSSAVDGLFYEVSVGCVFGVVLADGRRLVVKAHQPRWSPAFLAAVHVVQARLGEVWSACARPVAGPSAMGRGFAVVETLLPDPGRAPIEPPMLAVSAAGLANQVLRCRGIDAPGLRGNPFASDDHDGLYPEPHSPLFDFDATAAGAAWIDDLAAAAKAARDEAPAPEVIAHGDWSARNVRVGRDAVRAVYDWDSLAIVPESTAVGIAAATWSAFGDDDDAIAPSVAEIAAYVDAYESARGRRFDDGEVLAVGGAALYALAYTARCEHAIDPAGERIGRARPRLAAEGRLLLDLPAHRRPT